MVTRRQALLGAAAVGAGAVGWWGRYTLGDSFEDHVAHVLGVPRGLARDFTAAARERLGGEYELRAAAFLFATTLPGSLLPDVAREEALEAFLGNVFGGPESFSRSFAYAGLRPRGRFGACAGLVR